MSAIENGDWISFTPINLLNIDSMTFRVDSVAGGTIEVHTDSPDGPLVGSATIPANSMAVYADVPVTVTDPGGTHELFLVFENASSGQQELFKLNYIDFNGQGVAQP